LRYSHGDIIDNLAKTCYRQQLPVIRGLLR
jgi:phage tail protein X